MNDSKISVRYAKALFNLALERNIIDAVKVDVEFLNEVCNLPEFNDFLNSPILPVSKKLIVIKNIFKGNILDMVYDFIVLMTTNRRESFLKIITLDYLKFYREFKGIVEAELTTAVAISEDNKQNIALLLKQLLGGDVDIKNKIKPDIIGGFVLRVDDKQIDASVKAQLLAYKTELKKAVN